MSSGLPLREHLIQRLTIFFSIQAFACFPVGKQLRYFREDFEVLLCGLFGNKQEDQQRHGLPVRRFESDRLSQAHEGGERMLQTLDASVGNGHTFAETGRAKALAREEIVGDDTAANAVLVLEDQARLLEYTFLASDGQSEDDIFEGKKFG